MELSIVIGAYQFIGFHLCKYLLEQGHEVLGADWTDDSRTDHPIEEKQLEIGRNANFNFTSLQELKNVNTQGNVTLYICLYDYIKKGTDKTIEIKKALDALMPKMHPAPRIIVLYPLGYTGDERKMFETLNGQDKIIYLPTIYGPWQPETMVFERGIHSNGAALATAEWKSEYMLDAIYITDFLDYFGDILEHSENSIMVKSTDFDQWKLCARAVFNRDPVDENSSVHEKDIATESFVYQLKNKVKPELGIQLQKAHHKRIETIQKWKLR
ncbi:hypothetical protein [Bacillus sp. V5-8f]|uniref:hypothetical protein n=1 Tax=Bacillus sp. V5-8f TaxID=2053044 RepID=UPI000C787BC6|nr:hypothetical protein [Bacillus sp. V5-8f]PLT33862.1 hypothetical protein CUU64_12170 [Bacillus sp. V5-8f]